MRGSCGGLAKVLLRSCGAPQDPLRSFSQVLRGCLAELRKTSARVLRRSCGGLAEVLRRSCGGPCGGLAEFIEILRRPPQDFKLLHYVVIGPVGALLDYIKLCIYHLLGCPTKAESNRGDWGSCITSRVI